MSDEPKTTKVYLMLEVEVEDVPWPGAVVDRVQYLMEQILFARCRGVQGKDYKYEMFGPMVVKKPVVLPEDIQSILGRDKMRGVPLHEQLRQAVIKDGKRPAKERFQGMIDRGAINEKGEVLLKGPFGEGEDE